MVSLFILSGYSFKRTPARSCFAKQARQLMLPYFIMAFMSIFITFLKNILMQRELLYHVGSSALGFITVCSYGATYWGIEIGNSGTGWFLVALFFAWNILNTVFLLEKESHRVLAVILLGLLGFSVGGTLQYMFCVTQSLRAVVFLYVGYLIKKQKFFYAKQPALLLGLLVISWGISLLFGGVAVAENVWRLGIFDFVGSISGSLLLLKGYSYLELPCNKITEMIMKAGRYSYWIMVIHGIDLAGMHVNVVMRRLGFPYVLNLLLHFIWSVSFICVGCLVTDRIVRLAKRRKEYGSGETVG